MSGYSVCSGGLLVYVGSGVFTSNAFIFVVENNRPGENLDGFNASSSFRGGDFFRDSVPAMDTIGIAARPGFDDRLTVAAGS